MDFYEKYMIICNYYFAHMYIVDTIINNKWIKISGQIVEIFIDKKLTFFLFNTIFILNEWILLLLHLSFIYYIFL